MNTRDLLIVNQNQALLKANGSKTNLDNVLSDAEWNIHSVHGASAAYTLLKEQHFLIALVLIEICKDELYLKNLKHLFESNPKTLWILLLPPQTCCDSEIHECPEKKLIIEYCYDYFTLPVDKDRLLFTLGHTYGMLDLSGNYDKKIFDYPSYKGIIGNSPLIKEVFIKIDKVARASSSVLIEGETGTGKELIANAIHNQSDRAEQLLVVVNCGAIPRDLVQAELFGFEKGAFTGAYQRKIGRIESAQGGILFLDEIGDLPLEQQANLLRFLEQKTIERIGGIDKIPVDVRVIAATHVDLNRLVQTGQFREDLFYRLRVLYIKTPPLRKRDNDAEIIAWYFFHKFLAEQKPKPKPKGFGLSALNVIRQYGWPGNVRELSNCINQALVMSENRLLTVEDLGLENRLLESRLTTTLEDSRTIADKHIINTALKLSNNNITQAAKQLNISRATLYRLLEKYQLNPSPFPKAYRKLSSASG